MKVVLCGPSHSGKSCLREGLKQALMALHRARKAPYPYFLTACPDGEGAWYGETVRNHPALAEKLKQEYKAQFTWRFAQNKAHEVKKVSEPLTLIDVGGIIDEKNWLIMRHATHAIVLSRDMNKILEWVTFCEELQLKIIAIIHSDYLGLCDRIESESPILKGSVHRLERGEDVSTRPIVQALARVLVRMTQEG